jgi:hypothetical protein
LQKETAAKENVKLFYHIIIMGGKNSFLLIHACMKNAKIQEKFYYLFEF